MAVVHAECHFKKIGVAVILGDGSPRMPECIETIAVFFFHAHIPANFADTVVHVRIETVEITVSLMEVKQVFVFFVRKILVKGWLDKRFYPHLHIGFIPSAVPGLRPLVTYYAVIVVFLFQTIQVYRIDATDTEWEKCNIPAKFG